MDAFAKKRAVIVAKELERLYPTIKMALNWKTHWQLLLAIMLSAQTTDKQVNVVTKDLFKKYKSVQDYADANIATFQKDISSIGLYRNKGKNAVTAAKMIVAQHKGRVPKTMEDLVALPGVGRKTANVFLAAAHGITVGIAVDTHVTRLARQFGLTKESTPTKIEKDLMAVLPAKYWRYFTTRMVQYGRDYSPAKNKNHDDPISKKLEQKKLL